MSMLRFEYRIILPISVKEYEIAKLYSVTEFSKLETGGGEGVEVVVNEPRIENGEKEQYTFKIYHLASKIPRFIRALAPKGSLEIKEESHNLYPNIKTTMSNNYMKNGFKMEINSKVMENFGQSENVHNLPPEEWKNTQVVWIDFVNDQVSSTDYKKEFDPTLFVSKTSDCGPLGPDWIEKLKAKVKDSDQPVAYSCVYKLVSCRFEWFGLQQTIENRIQKEERRLFINFYRHLFCWMDDWKGLTLDDVRKLEEKSKNELNELRREGSIRGMVSH